MPRSSVPPQPFAVGDRVIVQIGPTSTVAAEILEDRGLIGHARRQYYRIRTDEPDWSEQTSFEVPLDRIRADTRRRNKRPTPANGR